MTPMGLFVCMRIRKFEYGIGFASRGRILSYWPDTMILTMAPMTMIAPTAPMIE